MSANDVQTFEPTSDSKLESKVVYKHIFAFEIFRRVWSTNVRVANTTHTMEPISNLKFEWRGAGEMDLLRSVRYVIGLVWS